MITGLDKFINTLTEVVRLYQRCRQFNLPFNSFSYFIDYDDHNLVLVVSFPNNSMNARYTLGADKPVEFDEIMNQATMYADKKFNIISEKHESLVSENDGR